MSFIQSIVEGYTNFMETKSDPRTANWPLVGGLGPLAAILVAYLYFCISLGPRLMRDRKPYDLKNVIRIYNASQVLLSILLVYMGLNGGWMTDYKFSCQPVDYSNSAQAMTMASAVYLYYICKLIELLDTIFFVLRKKYNQVSFLHLYHHTMMPVCAWIGVRFLPGGHGTLLGIINSFIHIIMYMYYFLASMGPQYQKYLWWKKHLTGLQMVQFCIVFVHNFQVLFRSCNYPKAISFLLAVQALYFLYLFGRFYYMSYVKKSASSSSSSSEAHQKTVNGDYKINHENNNLKNGKLKSH